MGVSTILLLIAIGISAGILSGFIGVGGGIVIVPALVFIMGFTQHEAQGLSIATMLPPIGIMAFYSYWQHGTITKNSIGYAAVIAIAFVIGGFYMALSFAQWRGGHLIEGDNPPYHKNNI